MAIEFDAEYFRDIDWKDLLGNMLKAIVDIKIIAMFFLIFAIGYMGGYEQVYLAMNSKLQATEQQLTILQEKNSKQFGILAQLNAWKRQTASVDQDMILLEPDESPRVVALKESERIINLSKGSGRDIEKFPSLPPPHDRLNFNKVDFLSNQSKSIDLMNPSGGSEPKTDVVMESFELGQISILVDRYVYEMELSGTYPGVVDFINQLVGANDLIRVQDVRITPIDQSEELRPDPDIESDFPVDVNMVVTFTFYLSKKDA